MRPPVLVVAVLLCSCPVLPVGADAGTTKPPPQVFLSPTEGNVIDTVLTGKVSVSGCATVAQVQLLAQGAFVADLHFTSNPTSFSLPGNVFAGLYRDLGFAASLPLSAKVICDDGRTNTSPVTPVSFFPVASRLSGTQAVLPDAFVVEGGLGGTPVTFLGCIPLSGGTIFARVDLTGNATLSDALPFDCGPNTQLSERSTVTGTRWVLEPGKGAYALDRGLHVVRQLAGSLQRMGVGTNGTAIFWDDTLTEERLLKVDPFVMGANDWSVPIAGIMTVDPVINVGERVVWASTWQLLDGIGDVVAFEFNLDTGMLINGAPILLRQDFGPNPVNSPLKPGGTFSADGSIMYLLVATQVEGVRHTTVLGCATSTSCDVNSGGRKFTTRNFLGEVNGVLPISAGNLLALVGPTAVWLVDAQTGTVRNLSEHAIAPSSEGLQIRSVTAGVSSEVYVLAGPASTTHPFPTEAIAVDSPENGELYRFTFGSGESPSSAIAMGVDEGGQAWFRVGGDQVKPLTLLEYRAARGATVIR